MFSGGFTAEIHVAIIRVADEGMPAPLQFPVEVRQHDVAQERRERAALRRSFLSLVGDPVTHQACFQKPADEPEHPAIPDLARHSRHQEIVVHTVEELGQIDVHDPGPSASYVGARRLHGLPRVASGLKP